MLPIRALALASARLGIQPPALRPRRAHAALLADAALLCCCAPPQVGQRTGPSARRRRGQPCRTPSAQAWPSWRCRSTTPPRQRPPSGGATARQTMSISRWRQPRESRCFAALRGRALFSKKESQGSSPGMLRTGLTASVRACSRPNRRLAGTGRAEQAELHRRGHHVRIDAARFRGHRLLCRPPFRAACRALGRRGCRRWLGGQRQAARARLAHTDPVAARRRPAAAPPLRGDVAWSRALRRARARASLLAQPAVAAGGAGGVRGGRHVRAAALRGCVRDQAAQRRRV